MRFAGTLAVACLLGLRRVRAGGTAAGLVVVGVAIATALVAAVLVTTKGVERRAVDRSLAELAPEERSVRAVWFGVPAQAEPYRRLDTAARRALARVVAAPVTATVLFRESTNRGAFVAVGGVAGLARFVALSSGRLPRRCDEVRCEVVQLRGGGRLPRRFVVVGRGRLNDRALFGDAVPAEGNQLARAQLAPALQRSARYHQPAPPPLLLTSGVRALSALASLRSSYRSYGWVVSLEPGVLDPWEVRAATAEAARARASLQTRSVGFDVLAPTEELRAATERAEIGGRRLLVLGGQGVALVLAFGALAATRLRAAAARDDRRLWLLGVRRWPRAVAIATHAAALVVAGTAGAWIVAFAAVAAVDAELASAALLSRGALAAAAALGAATFAVVVVALTAAGGSARRSVGWLDAAAVGLLLAVGAMLVRGAADADEVLRGRGSGVVLLALPVAVVAVAAIGTARALGPAMRLVERALPRAMVAARLAVASLARRPGAGSAAAAFFVVSVAFAVFAASYRTTLDRGQRTQAAFALGADIVLREDLRRLVPVRDVATRPRLDALGPGVVAAPVVRQSANVAGAGALTGITLLGLPPASLGTLRGADLDVPELTIPSELRGPRLPEGATTLAIGGRSSVGGVRLAVAVMSDSGTHERIELALPGRAAIPPAARGGTVLGLEILPPPRLQERGADAGRPVVAELELAPLRAGPTIVSTYRGWVGVGGASVDGARVTATLTNQIETWFRPRQTLDETALPAVVSPLLAQLADGAGRLSLEVGGHPIRLRVVAVAPRFPSARGDFAVADRAALENALNLAAPGSGFSTEVWVNGTTPAAEAAARARLRRAPYDVLALDSRVERETRLRSDPLARGALTMLLGAAAISLLLALVALALAVADDLRDERGELLDLETQGARPSTLRRLVQLRQLAAAALGVASGLVTGGVLAALVVAAVTVSAGGERPVPPLTLTVDGGWIVATLAVVAVFAATVVVAATQRAFRARVPGRPVVEAE
jgi:hypothetical protein